MSHCTRSHDSSPLNHAVIFQAFDGPRSQRRGAVHAVGHDGEEVGNREEHERRPYHRREHELQPGGDLWCFGYFEKKVV